MTMTMFTSPIAQGLVRQATCETGTLASWRRQLMRTSSWLAVLEFGRDLATYF